MGDNSGIGWTDATWNPTGGCSIVSPGCANCYAMGEAARNTAQLAAQGIVGPYAGLTQPSKAGPVWTGEVRLNEKALDLPLRWTRPRRVFVDSMSDLFHPGAPTAWVDRVFAVMAQARQHTFQLLTKRADRMRAYLNDPDTPRRIGALVGGGIVAGLDLSGTAEDVAARYPDPPAIAWPLANLWAGVSVEDQPRADERVPILLDTIAAVRWVSAEPLLGPIDFTRLNGPWRARDALSGLTYWAPGAAPIGSRLDWIVVGGESGPGARPCLPAWARAIRDQCAAAGVAFDFKQWGDFLVGEFTGEPTDDNPLGLPIRFQDGATFDVHSDGQDIVLGAALDEPGGPRKVWGPFWGWRPPGAPPGPGRGLLAKRPGKRAAGRLLDGQVHDGRPLLAVETQGRA